ncbi:MAG: FlgD immunoglobulin-like domain containing protein [bacterium]
MLDSQVKGSQAEFKQYPSDWGWMQRTFPYWKADKTALAEALQYAQHLREAAKYPVDDRRGLQKSGGTQQWEFAGPANIGGRVSDIEFNPVDPNIVYAAAATGGVFKSTDGGLSWIPVFDDAAIFTIGDLAVDPSDPDLVYVGTGEANGGHNNFPGGGVYKSTDAGASWQFLGLEQAVSIGRIVVDPVDSRRLFVAAVGSYFGPNPERGLYRSEDGGANWSRVLFVSDTTGVIDLVLNPQNPSFVLAATWERVRRPNNSHLYGSTSGLYRSVDGGDTWELLGPVNGLPDATTTNVGRIGLALCQSSPQVIYALYNDGLNYSGLFRTSDSGDTWVNADPNREILNGTGGFSWYFGQVRIDPFDPNRVFVLDVGFMRSTDSGDTWTITRGSRNLHVDHHALAFHPSEPDYLIDGNDGGISISSDGGATWTKVANLPVTQFYEIGIDNSNPERLLGGTQDNGTLRTVTGTVDDWDTILGGDGFYVLVDPNDPDVIYAESQFGGLVKSVNGGGSFFPARVGIVSSEPTNWSTPVVMDPNNSQVLYYGTNRVYRTENAAQSWVPISPDLTEGMPGARLGTVTTIAVAPTDSNVIYAGTDDSHVWVSSDRGGSWTEVSAALPYRWVTRIVVDPADENTAYVTFSGLKWKDPQPHVFRTTNMGADWQDISSNLPDAPVNAFAVDPLDSQVLYLGSDVGAFVSFNTGQTWEALGTGLPMVPVYDMKIHQAEHFLVVGTHGRSMYKLDLSSLVTDVQAPSEVPSVASFELKQNYPNPFNPNTNIRYSLVEPGRVSLKIYNLLGEEVRTLVDEVQSAGNFQSHWDGTNKQGEPVSSGVYLYELKTSTSAQFKRMILLR